MDKKDKEIEINEPRMVKSHDVKLITIIHKSRTLKTPTTRWRIGETACFRKFE